MVNLRELETPLLTRVRGQIWDDSSMAERRILIPRVPGSIPGHLATGRKMLTMEKQEVMSKGATLILRARSIESLSRGTVFLLFLAGPAMFLMVILGSVQQSSFLVYLGFGVFVFTILFAFFSGLAGDVLAKRIRARAVELYDSVGIKISGE